MSTWSKFCEKSKKLHEKQKNFLFCRHCDAVNFNKSMRTKIEFQEAQFTFKAKEEIKSQSINIDFTFFFVASFILTRFAFKKISIINISKSLLRTDIFVINYYKFRVIAIAQQLNNFKHFHSKIFTRKDFNISMMSQNTLTARTKKIIKEQKIVVRVIEQINEILYRENQEIHRKMMNIKTRNK